LGSTDILEYPLSRPTRDLLNEYLFADPKNETASIFPPPPEKGFDFQAHELFPPYMDEDGNMTNPMIAQYDSYDAFIAPDGHGSHIRPRHEQFLYDENATVLTDEEIERRANKLQFRITKYFHFPPGTPKSERVIVPEEKKERARGKKNDKAALQEKEKQEEKRKKEAEKKSAKKK
jgi:hypothetical protein